MDENKDSLNVSDLGAPLPALAAGLSAEDRAGLVSVPKSMAGEHSYWFKNLNPKVRKWKRKRVELLSEIQDQHDELEAKFFEERAALEAKYQKLYEPLYTKRYKIVNGVVEVESDAKENAEETKNKGLPGFWLTVLKNDDVLPKKINERDEKALKFLKDIKWSRIDFPGDFKLEFFFDSNPYFKNSVLTKTFSMTGDYEPIPVKTIGTEIEWYPGKCLTRKILKMQPEKGSKNATKAITKTEYCWSFFNFFNTVQISKYNKDIAKLIEQDYIIGSTIRDKIIPHAVSWYVGEAVLDGNFQDLVGDDGDEEDDDEDVDEEEDSKPKGFVHTYLDSADRCCFVGREHSWSRSPSPESASSIELCGEGTSTFGIPSVLSGCV